MSLRVVHIVSSMNVGGMEQFVVRLAGRQLGTGICASIIALQGGPLHTAAVAGGVPTLVLGGRSRAVRILKAIAALCRLNPDLVHGHNATSLHYALLAQRCTRAKIVVTHHGRGKSDYREPAPESWRRVDSVVCVSAAAATDAPAGVPRERLSVIRNGVDPACQARPREETRQALGLEDGFTALIVARIDHLKGHDTLLRAWASLPNAGRLRTLLVVGDGAERSAIERLAAELGISASVRFLGFRSDVNDLLAACDLFVLPSRSEGLPLSILEAMTHRLPIAATRVGGIPEIVTDGQEGLLVPPGDPMALSAAISRLETNDELRREMGSNALRRAESEFSFDAMVSQYDALYHALMRRSDAREAHRHAD